MLVPDCRQNCPPIGKWVEGFIWAGKEGTGTQRRRELHFPPEKKTCEETGYRGNCSFSSSPSRPPPETGLPRGKSLAARCRRGLFPRGATRWRRCAAPGSGGGGGSCRGWRGRSADGPSGVGGGDTALRGRRGKAPRLPGEGPGSGSAPP